MIKIIEMPPRNDNEILRLFLAGDTAAIKIVEQWIRGVVFCRFHFTDEEANDLTQESLLHLFRACQKPGFRIQDSLKALVRTIAARRCMEKINPGYKVQQVEDNFLENTAGSSGNHHREIVLEEFGKMLRSALARLSAVCKITLGLRFFGKLKIRQIASRLGRSEGTVKANLNRCLEELRPVFRQLMKSHQLDRNDFLSEYDL